jgi:hypothetical protein
MLNRIFFSFFRKIYLFPYNINYRKLLRLVQIIPVDKVEGQIETAFNFCVVDEIPDEIGAPVVFLPVKPVSVFKPVTISRVQY